jgi:hypothetical protein
MQQDRGISTQDFCHKKTQRSQRQGFIFFIFCVLCGLSWQFNFGCGVSRAAPVR